MRACAGPRYRAGPTAICPAIPEINAAYPGYGDPVRQANKNFAPQIGLPGTRGACKTVIRGGIGCFYENVIYNNVLFDRPLRLRTGPSTK